MSSARRQRHPLIVGLLLAAIVYRALIPAGFMPATGEAAHKGALLVICHHGELGLNQKGGNGSGGTSVDQCPFGAATGAAVPTPKVVLYFPPVQTRSESDRDVLLNGGSSPHLQPPARAPPIFS